MVQPYEIPGFSGPRRCWVQVEVASCLSLRFDQQVLARKLSFSPGCTEVSWFSFCRQDFPPGRLLFMEVSGMSYWEESSRWTQNSLRGIIDPLLLEHVEVPQKELESVAGNGEEPQPSYGQVVIDWDVCVVYTLLLIDCFLSCSPFLVYFFAALERHLKAWQSYCSLLGYIL